MMANIASKHFETILRITTPVKLSDLLQDVSAKSIPVLVHKPLPVWMVVKEGVFQSIESYFYILLDEASQSTPVIEILLVIPAKYTGILMLFDTGT